MKKITGFGFVFFFIFLSIFKAHAAGVEPRIIRFAVVAPSGTAWTDEIRKNALEIEKSSGGRIQLKVYDSAKMGDEPDYIRKMRSGQLQSAAFTGYGLALVEKSILVMELPFLFESDEEANYVYEKMLPFFQKRFEAKGFVLLDFATYGKVYFMTNKPVNSLADLQKVKMWVWEGDPLLNQYFKMLSLPVAGLPLTEVLVGLQSGMIEGVYCPPLAAVGFQWWTKTNYIAQPPFRTGINGILTDKKNWDSLPAQDQALVRSTLRKTVARLSEMVRVDNEKALQSLVQNKVTLNTWDETDLRSFKAKSAEFRSQMTGEVYDAAALAEVESHIKQFRATAKKP